MLESWTRLRIGIEENGAYALFTKTSISLKSSGSELRKPLISVGLLTSSLTGQTFTPLPTSFSISLAISCNASSRRAVRMSFRFLGDCRANSNAVLRPIPADAPVMTIVLPSRFFEADISWKGRVRIWSF